MTFFINNFIINYRIFNQKKLIKLTNLQRETFITKNHLTYIYFFNFF